MKQISAIRSRALARLVLSVVFAAPVTAGAQHTDHTAKRDIAADTLATAPTTPSRPVTDSGAVADSLLKLCRSHVDHSIEAYADCIGGGIASLSSAGNIALALGTLDRIVNSDRSLVLVGHPLAHALGYAVRSTPATASRLLSQCDDRYQSGCYHGILQRYFDARIGFPIEQSVLIAPCEPLRGTAEQFRLFDCLHGTGHGLMMYHRYDVRAALPDCDRLGTDWDRRSCYGGVFMEHNMGARMQAFGDAALGMHRHSSPASSVTLFKANDLHYPCNVTPDRYRMECYALQADVILPAVEQDYQRAGKVCDAAGTPALVHACYAGLGRNASGAAAFGFEGIRRRCDKSSARGAPSCYQGAVRHLAYAPSELARGVSFCRTLPSGEIRARCWGGLGLQIGGFFSDLTSRRKACESERPADVAACVEGAGLAGKRTNAEERRG